MGNPALPLASPEVWFTTAEAARYCRFALPAPEATEADAAETLRRLRYAREHGHVYTGHPTEGCAACVVRVVGRWGRR